jgi:hypothetical protein
VFDDSRRYFTDDGRPFNPDLVPVPDLCVSCAKNGAPNEDVVCALTRADQCGEDVFLCFGYEPASPSVDREAVLHDLCRRAGVACPEDSSETDGDDAGPVSF